MSSSNPYHRKPTYVDQSINKVNVDSNECALGSHGIEANEVRNIEENQFRQTSSISPNNEQIQNYYPSHHPIQQSFTDSNRPKSSAKKTMIAINQHQQLQFHMGNYPYPPPPMNPMAYYPFMYNNNNNEDNSSGTQPFMGIPPWSMPPQYQQPPEKRYVKDTSTGEHLLDETGEPITVERYLATKPLRKDLSTRPGPGNCQLTYISGDVVTRTLNEAFGFEGWSIETKSQSQIGETEKDSRGRFKINYQSTVRITLTRSGAFREDVGFGDSIDRDFGTAMAHAAKSSVTDAMKRAARHFGEKLGNTLYSGSFNIRKAPVALADALAIAKREVITSAYGQRALPQNHPSLANSTPPKKREEISNSVQNPLVVPKTEISNGCTAAVAPSSSFAGDATKTQIKATISTNTMSASHSSSLQQQKNLMKPSVVSSSGYSNSSASTNNGTNQSIQNGQPTGSSSNQYASSNTNVIGQTNATNRTLSRTVTNTGTHNTNSNPYSMKPNSVQFHGINPESEHPNQLNIQQGLKTNSLANKGGEQGTSDPTGSSSINQNIGQGSSHNKTTTSTSMKYNNNTKPLTDVSNVSHSSSFHGKICNLPQQQYQKQTYNTNAGKRQHQDTSANDTNIHQQQPVKRPAVNPYQLRH